MTGAIALIPLVESTLKKLLTMLNGLQPTDEELESVKQGRFKVHRIDLNKAMLFDSKEQAQLYLALIKEHGSYPRRKKDVEKNGVYFGKTSKRTTLVYYHKGNELLAHKKQQANLTVSVR